MLIFVLMGKVWIALVSPQYRSRQGATLLSLECTTNCTVLWALAIVVAIPRANGILRRRFGNGFSRTTTFSLKTLHRQN
jgi:hypothetical protein